MTKIRGLLAAAVFTVAPVWFAAPAAHAEYFTGACERGYSCYYDGLSATGTRWRAPSCGFWDLGLQSPPFNDRIESIVNRGGGAIQAYNWVGAWQPVGPPVAAGSIANYENNRANIIDAVSIAC